MNSRVRFVVIFDSFAAVSCLDSRRGDQVAFVGGIDEHLSRVGFSVQCLNEFDATILLLDSLFPIQPSVANDGDVVFGQHLIEDVFGDVWFKHPHRCLVIVTGPVPLGAVAVLLSRLEFPGRVVLVVLVDAVVEVLREATNHPFIAGVGPTESATGQAAQMFVGRNHDDRLPHASRLNRCGNGGCGSAVNDNVVGRFSICA